MKRILLTLFLLNGACADLATIRRVEPLAPQPAFAPQRVVLVNQYNQPVPAPAPVPVPGVVHAYVPVGARGRRP